MVYRGRPSTGCFKCRQRKIKCDERPGGCFKCEDKGFSCPGYEKAIDRLFQDESAAVEKKAQKAKAKALVARDERDKEERARRVARKIRHSLEVPLLCPLIDQGIAYFMMNYATGIDEPPMSSSAYSRHLSTYGFHPIVSTIMTALGLAGVANLFMDGGLKREATKWYGDALKMTNYALTNPLEAKSDNTLLAIMLLSVFEATDNEKSLIGWAQHVTGSASLLRMRGKKQFETNAGRRMYMQTVGLLTIKCMGMGIAIPHYIHELNEEISKWEDPADPGNRFFHMHIAVIDFRAQILSHELTDLGKIVERALEIDAMATTIFESVGQDWEYIVESCDEGTPGVFGTEFHIYPHLAAAQTWNWVRYNRIYIHDIIRNSLIVGFGSTPPVFVGKKYIALLESSTETLYKMQADILASVPQYMHDTPKVPSSTHVAASTSESISYTSTTSGQFAPPPPAPSPTPSSSSTSTSSTTTTALPRLAPHKKTIIENFSPSPVTTVPKFSDADIPPNAKLPIIRISGGYSSLWGVFIAGSTPIASPESQAYVLHTLGRVASEFGINQAHVLATALRTKIALERAGISGYAERAMDRDWEGAWYDGLGEMQKALPRNAALRGGEGGIVPVYMPRVGSHLE